MDITAFLNAENSVQILDRIENVFRQKLVNVDMFTASLICFIAVGVFASCQLLCERESLSDCFFECEVFSFFTLLIVELFGYFKYIDISSPFIFFTVAQICEFVALTVLYAVIFSLRSKDFSTSLPENTDAVFLDVDKIAISLDINRVKRYGATNYEDFKIERIYLQKKECDKFYSPVNLGYVLGCLKDLKKCRLDFKESRFVEQSIEKVCNYKYQKPKDYFSEFSEITSQTVCLMAKYLK